MSTQYTYISENESPISQIHKSYLIRINSSILAPKSTCQIKPNPIFAVLVYGISLKSIFGK